MKIERGRRNKKGEGEIRGKGEGGNMLRNVEQTVNRARRKQ